MGDTTTDAATADPMDGFREVMRAMWSGVAPAWDAYADDVEARGRGRHARRCSRRPGSGPGLDVLELGVRRRAASGSRRRAGSDRRRACS